MSYLQLADGTPADELYVRIPDGNGGTIRVREDYFDRFSDQDFDDIMDTIEPSMNGKAERQARREERQAAKALKKEGRGGAARRDARQKRLETRQAAKNERAAAGGGFGGALDKIGGIAKNILGGVTGQGGEPMERAELELAYNDNPDAAKKWYQNPLVIVGGVAVVGLGIYLATKKKK